MFKKIRFQNLDKNKFLVWLCPNTIRHIHLVQQSDSSNTFESLILYYDPTLVYDFERRIFHESLFNGATNSRLYFSQFECCWISGTIVRSLKYFMHFYFEMAFKDAKCFARCYNLREVMCHLHTEALYHWFRICVYLAELHIMLHLFLGLIKIKVQLIL